MSLNVVAMVGRLVADPELRTTSGGTEVVTFRIAVDRPYSKDANAQKADFFTVVAWANTALFVSRYFAKGSAIGIQGNLQSRSYEDRNGEKKTAIEIVAREVSFCGSTAVTTSAPTQGNQGYTTTYKQTPATPTYSASSDFEALDDDDDDDYGPPF